MTITKNFSTSTERRFIAYFDIMGFKDYMYRNGHTAVQRRFNSVSTIIDQIKSAQLVSNGSSDLVVHPIMFSDTILFICKGGTLEDLNNLSILSLLFLNRMFQEKIPIKGAIAFGNFTADIESSVFFGRPLVDAYLLTEELHFYGVGFHWSAEKQYKKLNKKANQKFIRSGEVPTKGGGGVTHYYLDWSSISTCNIDKPANLDNLYLSVSGKTRKYVDNTIECYSIKKQDS